MGVVRGAASESWAELSCGDVGLWWGTATASFARTSIEAALRDKTSARSMVGEVPIQITTEADVSTNVTKARFKLVLSTVKSDSVSIRHFACHSLSVQPT